MANRKKGDAGRAYARLTRHDRNQIEEMLKKRASCRQIAKAIGRAPSTVSNEVERHRYVVAPKALEGAKAPDGLEAACEILAAWPRCCNGCRRASGYGCSRKPRVKYSARLAQEDADRVLVESRRGVDEDEPEFQRKLGIIRSGMGRGLSPEQIAALHPDLGVSAATIYRWCDRGYGQMTNMELRRKVGYKKRRRGAPKKTTGHDPRRSHDEFGKLPEDERAACWEMDTVEGSKLDAACLLTILHRPSRFQLALPLASKTCGETKAALGLVVDALGGEEAARRVFGTVLTDNGPEFSDEDGIAALLGERPGETRLFYCDPMRSDQKGACEKNHVEIRKLVPKGRGYRLDRLEREDATLLMSQINSTPRGALAFMSPIQVFRAAFGEDAERLLDALGVELLGGEQLNLTEGYLDEQRTKRGAAPLQG